LFAAAAAVALGLGTPAIAHAATARAQHSGGDKLPVHAIEQAMQSDGTVSSGILSIEQDRSDIHAKGGNPRVTFVDGFQLQNEFFFQSLGHGRAIMNGDMALRERELQPVIDAILSHGLVFQAEHQHLTDIEPMVWFIHLRGTGDAVDLAKRVDAVVHRTSTPLPATSPAHPTTPLPAKKIGAILGGDVTVGSNGVVTVAVPRKHGVVLGGVHVSPDLNVETNIQFEPLGKGRAAAVPDFSMTANEVQTVTRIMRAHGWEIGCLYNQETAEQPQLYFSHTFKTGDPVQLAKEIKAALVHTDV
jgi:hypothetical protein